MAKDITDPEIDRDLPEELNYKQTVDLTLPNA